MNEVRRKRYRSKKLRKRKWKRIRKKILRILILFLPIFLIIGGITAIMRFRKPHFKFNTTIAGVECSWLTLEKAEEKLNKELKKQNITFVFSDFDKHFDSAELYNFEPVQLEQSLKNFYEIQKENKTKKEFDFNSYSFDGQTLLATLQEFPNFQEENMERTENAYLAISDSNYLIIIPEVLGNWINFNEAFNFACENLKKGSTTIDFSTLYESPAVLADDKKLVSQRDQLNTILSSKIDLTFSNDTILSLNNDVMVTWLNRDENGNYTIDIDSNLPKFVTSLAEEAYDISSHVNFKSTDVGTVIVPVAEKYRAVVNEAKELSQLKSEILSGKTVTRSPIYTSEPISLDNVISYIELDISRQTVFMYIDGKCILETPCVTGDVSDGNGTPIGLYYLTYKTTDDYLEGYNNDGTRYKSFVYYWMPFNGGIGFHDATWRKPEEFGEDTYLTNGSHGCVNLPLEYAKTIYKHIDKSMPIILYESGVI